MRLFRSHFLIDPQSPHKSLVVLVRLKRGGMALSRFVVCRDQGRNENEDRIYGIKPGAKGKQGKREMRQRIEQEKRRKKKEQLRSLARWPCVAGPSLGPASPTPPPPFSPGHCRSPAGTYSSILLGAGFLGPLSCPSVGGGGGGGGLLGCVPI